jgi:serine/threonine-protein kinase HipA
MAKSHWGKVFFQDRFAGILREEPGDCFSFEYEDSYLLSQENPAISYSLPKESKRHMSYHGLHPFFDNLVAEGWLAEAQTRLLGARTISRFRLLLDPQVFQPNKILFMRHTSFSKTPPVPTDPNLDH